MREETLAELLRSPLDEERSSRALPGWLAPFVGALLAGVVVGLAWVSVRGGEQTLVAVPTTAANIDVPGEQPRFPATHRAISEDVALRPVSVYGGDGHVVVVVSAVSAAGVPPEDTPAFPGGVWAMRDVEGRVVDEYAEVRNPQALGTTAVRFPADQSSQPRTLVLTPLTPAEVITASIPVDLPGFPFVTGRSFEVALASDLRLSAILLRLNEEAGLVQWTLRGADGLAQVDMVVTLPETASGGEAPTSLRSEHIAPPYPFQRQRLPRPAPSRSGSDVLRRSGPEIEDAGVVTRAVIDVTVRLYRTQDDAVVEFDLAEVSR